MIDRKTLHKITIFIACLQEWQPEYINPIMAQLGTDQAETILRNVKNIGVIPRGKKKRVLDEIKKRINEFGEFNPIKFKSNSSKALKLLSEDDFKMIFESEPTGVLARYASTLKEPAYTNFMNLLSIEENAKVSERFFKQQDLNSTIQDYLKVFFENKIKQARQNESQGNVSYSTEKMEKVIQGIMGLEREQQKELLSKISKNDDELSSEIAANLLTIDSFIKFDSNLKDQILEQYEDIDSLICCCFSYSDEEKMLIASSLTERKKKIFIEKKDLIQAPTHKDIKLAQESFLSFISDFCKKNNIDLKELLKKINKSI